MNVRDTKLVLELFLDRTQVIRTTDFNMLYDIFMGKEVKPLTARLLNQVVDLFFDYGKRPKMNVRDTKLILDLYFDKTQVIKSPDFNMLYDLFMGVEVKPLSAKVFVTVSDLFFGYGKQQRMQAKDSKLMYDLFLDKT